MADKFPNVVLQPRIPFPGHGSFKSRELLGRTFRGARQRAWSVLGSVASRVGGRKGVNLAFSRGQRRVAECRWEKPDRERADPGRPTSSRTGKHPQALRNYGSRRGLGRGAVPVCRVPGNRDHQTVAAATERTLSPPSQALFCPPVPTTSRAASLVCCPCLAHAWKRSGGGSHALGG